MITFHHLEYSQSFRILWLLEELGLDYELQLHRRDPETRLASPDYKKVSPLGTAPVIEIDGTPLAESNAITDLLIDQTPDGERLRPGRGDAERMTYLFWFHASQGSLMPLLLMGAVMRAVGGNMPRLVRPVGKKITDGVASGFVQPRLGALLDRLEADLEGGPWICGDRLTAADISLSYPLESLEAYGRLEGYPRCAAWVAHARQWPSYARALEKDGTGQVAFTG